MFNKLIYVGQWIYICLKQTLSDNLVYRLFICFWESTYYRKSTRILLGLLTNAIQLVVQNTYFSICTISFLQHSTQRVLKASFILVSNKGTPLLSFMKDFKCIFMFFLNTVFKILSIQLFAFFVWIIRYTRVLNLK